MAYLGLPCYYLLQEDNTACLAPAAIPAAGTGAAGNGAAFSNICAVIQADPWVEFLPQHYLPYFLDSEMLWQRVYYFK